MYSSLFFRLFPPPKFMMMLHCGFEISDDALRLIEYKRGRFGLMISKYDSLELPKGLIDGGEIKDEKKFADIVSAFIKKNKITYAKISLPEEKAYLFQTDIPSNDVLAITQNVEFKLEENVPLQATDAIFYFDILPASVTGDALRASVSVVPRTYVEKIISFLRPAGVIPVAFEVAPKSIARSIVPIQSKETLLALHVMNHKTGIYIVSGGVVCFSSTISTEGFDYKALRKEIARVNEYWSNRADTHSTIARTVFVGYGVAKSKKIIESEFDETRLAVSIADVWSNIFDTSVYSPPISRIDSLEYAVAAGLALPI
jgi:Tfp pilus assembly PilM family ATPase